MGSGSVFKVFTANWIPSHVCSTEYESGTWVRLYHRSVLKPLLMLFWVSFAHAHLVGEPGTCVGSYRDTWIERLSFSSSPVISPASKDSLFQFSD